MPPTCRIHISNRGTRTHREIADLLRIVLDEAGLATTVHLDEVPTGGSGVVDVIVAPYQFLTLDPSLTVDQRLEIAAACVLVATEPEGSQFWERQRRFCEVALLTLALSPVSIPFFRAHGIEAIRLPIGYHPSLDHWGGPRADGDGPARDIDVTLIASATRRRLEALGPLAPTLAHRETRLLLHDPLIPIGRDGTVPSSDDRADVLRRSRVLLDVQDGHHDQFPWTRAMTAISNGAVVLAEAPFGSDPLRPFEHFVASPPALLGDHLTALVVDEATRSSMAAAAYDFIRSEWRMDDLVRATVLDALVAAAGTETLVGFTAADLPDRELPRATRPAPGPPADPVLTATRAELKQALIDRTRAQRQLQRALAELEGRDPEEIEERTTPAWEARSGDLDLSVVLPLYNYEGTVEQALDSVFASRGVTAEVIVIDDCSGDGSADVVAAYLDQHPDRPILALLRRVNAGPSAARNLGVQRARTDHIFLLDADNTLYPDGLRRLHEALTTSEAELAYGILEMFGDQSSLVSAMPWSIESLVLRPYIDNMCLVHRTTWEKLGGFPDDEGGLEDYQFFIALAASGGRVEWVPEVVGRYRLHGSSRGSVVSLDLETPVANLRESYPHLPWPAT